MSSSILPNEIRVDHDAAAATRKQASAATVARADVDNLRDDPEARSAFLSTFSAEEERSILNKIDKRFLVIIGFMYMIKQVWPLWRGAGMVHTNWS